MSYIKVVWRGVNLDQHGYKPWSLWGYLIKLVLYFTSFSLICLPLLENFMKKIINQIQIIKMSLWAVILLNN